MAYDILEKYINQNRSGRNLKAAGTVLHETATPNATAMNERDYFNSGYRGSSAHAFVDYNSIVQCIPWKEQAWHAGQTANSIYIGIELCHFDDEAHFKEIWKRAVWLFAHVHANVINVTEVNEDTLLSHDEVSKRWKETNHSDPVAYFAKFGKTVEDFRKEVQVLVNEMIGKPNLNNKILLLQQCLNRLKIRDNRGDALVEDGLNGPKTTAAVKRFQYIAGLEVTGEGNDTTLKAINLILGKPYCSMNIKPSPIVVKYIQFRVGAEYDGVWGPLTDKAVAKWQADKGLTPDSKVGSNTWNKLIG